VPCPRRLMSFIDRPSSSDLELEKNPLVVGYPAELFTRLESSSDIRTEAASRHQALTPFR
jgi:hypothetical protein